MFVCQTHVLIDQAGNNIPARGNKIWLFDPITRLAVRGTTTKSANTAVKASQLLTTGSSPITWNSVGWNSVGWNTVGWNTVGWNTVGWNTVGWNSDYWEQ